MSLYNMQTFSEYIPPDPVDTSQTIPKEFEIYYRDIQDFIPQGKSLEDLTPQELELVKNRYRFDPMRPGIYQGLTGYACMIQ